MNRFADEILIGAFEKNGLVYHVLIAKDSDEQEKLIPTVKFKGIFLQPLKKAITVFHICMDEDGRWIPDKRRAIDPWVADYIGEIIQNHLA